MTRADYRVLQQKQNSEEEFLTKEALDFSKAALESLYSSKPYLKL